MIGVVVVVVVSDVGRRRMLFDFHVEVDNLSHWSTVGRGRVVNMNVPNMPSPTADDLLFLLSIVQTPNTVIAEHQQQSSSATPHAASTKAHVNVDGKQLSWQQTLASFPTQRRNVMLDLQRMINALDKWMKSDSDTRNRVNNQQLASVSLRESLQEVEEAATQLRDSVTQYQSALYQSSLSLFWNALPVSSTIGRSVTSTTQKNKYALERVGSQLATQLCNQLKWDEKMMHSVLTFLTDELYSSQQNITLNNILKLQAYSKSMRSMLQIDKSFWEFVEREVYDETELLENGGEAMFLNGEPSSVFVDMNIDGLSRVVGGRVRRKLVEDDADAENDSTSVDARFSSLHERIASSDSVEDATNTFLHSSSHSTSKTSSWQRNALMSSILLIGEEGCGKTHFLDTIQQRVKLMQSKVDVSVKVIRPKYPVDLIGNSIGSSEDRLISLFSYASSIVNTGGKCMILLDDIDTIFSLGDGDVISESPNVESSATQYYVGRRCKALFLSILDALRHQSRRDDDGGHLLLLCTSRKRCEEVSGRFDRIFTRGQMDEGQRREMILKCLSASNMEGLEKSAIAVDRSTEDMLSLVVHHSAGRPAFELSQCCREAILADAESTNDNSTDHNGILLKRLHRLDKMLQTKVPQSLRGGSLDGVVDMRIYAPEELLFNLTTDKHGLVRLPLLGAEAKRAFESLMNVVVTPLCRSDEIRELLYGGSEKGSNGVDFKPIRVGALLAGGPGVGKSSLAYHCASLAAKMSRVTLLDVSCTSLIHKEIGASERAVQRLFAAVRAAAPCILLLDGIENVAPKRGNDTTSEGTMDRVLSTFLTEMDGIESGSGGDNNGAAGNVGVIGITHNPDLIDPSLRRPGRLEKTITLGTPDFEARQQLVMQNIQDISFDFSSAGYFDAKNKEDVAKYVAMESAGMSAGEVIAICKEASMECLREIGFDVGDATKLALRHGHFKSAVGIMKGKSTT